MASLWANYRFSAFGVPGFLAGAGVRYNGHSFDGVGNNRVEGVTLYDAVLAYDRGPFRVALSVTNLFDKGIRGHLHRARRLLSTAHGGGQRDLSLLIRPARAIPIRYCTSPYKHAQRARIRFTLVG